MPVVGIDLGTTYSAVAVVGQLGQPEMLVNREGERITPSVVLFQGDATLVGSMALRSAPTAPDDVVQFVKRQMGDPSWKFTTSTGRQYSAEEVSALILRRLKDDAELALGSSVDSAVITVPAYFDDARRKATLDAGQIAGLDVKRVLNEPTAAALAYGLDSQADGTILVYDLGGGTFDVTIMRITGMDFDVVATMGTRNLGGFDWDNELMKYVNAQVVEQGGPDIFDDDVRTAELRDKSEMAKRTLTTMNETKVFISTEGGNFSVPLSREQFVALSRGLLGRTESITEMALEDAKLSWEAIDRVLLVGGSTRMPMVWDLVTRMSGKEPERSINPDEVVALGAAIQAHLCVEEGGERGRGYLAGTDGATPRISDVAALGLGILADDELDIERNFVLIAHNSKIPAKGSDVFYTKVENQRQIHIKITEGDDSDPSFVKIVGDSVFDMPPYPAEAPVEVRLSFDVDGIIHAEVFDGTTSKKLGDMQIDRVSNLTDDQIQAASLSIQRMEVN